MTPPSVRSIIPRVFRQTTSDEGRKGNSLDVSQSLVMLVEPVRIANIVVKFGYKCLRRWYLSKSAVQKCAEADLEALNSRAVLKGPGESLIPEVTTLKEREMLNHPGVVSEKALVLRRNHRMFCATWARIAKGKFDYAHLCIDTPLNRKALLRWLNKEWTKLGIPSHQLDIFMGDCINMCLGKGSLGENLVRRVMGLNPFPLVDTIPDRR
jgi:hypothetical protein